MKMRNKEKAILMNPGPVNVTDRVRKSLLRPDICHREEEFSTLLSSIRKKLLQLFHAEKTHTVALLTGSGTAALESALSSYASPGKKVLVLSNGVYGERMKAILELHGSPVTVLFAETGDFPSIEEAERLLQNDKAITAVGMVHHETSSGMLNPLSSVAALAKKYKKTLLLDAVSSLGAEKIDFARYSIGYCVGTSGKCLHGFPGVSFVFVAKSELAHLKSNSPKSIYLDLWNTLSLEENGDTPFTPAVQIFYALEAALDELARQGVDRRIEEYRKKSLYLEKEFIRLGLRFLVQKKFRSHVLTALWTPESVTYQTLHDRLKARGFVIYAGQSHLKSKIFRISNLGDIRLSDLKRFISELKKILSAR